MLEASRGRRAAGVSRAPRCFTRGETVCNFYWLQRVACKADQQFKKESCGVDSRSSLGVGFGGGGMGGSSWRECPPEVIYYSVKTQLYYHHHLCFSMAHWGPIVTQQLIKSTTPGDRGEVVEYILGAGGTLKKKTTRGNGKMEKREQGKGKGKKGKKGKREKGKRKVGSGR